MMKEEKWSFEVTLLKEIIERTGLNRATKWGSDVYTWKGKNVLSVGGFKNYFVLWFYNGVFLRDSMGVLVSAQEGKTKALRQWRFTHRDQIDESAILKYIQEAIENEEVGRVWKPERQKLPELPDLMKASFQTDKVLKSAFECLTPYKQREYIEHIASAKREETRLSRFEKCKDLILRGAGLHDKYKS